MKKENEFDPLVIHLAYELSSSALGRRKLTSRTFSSESKVRTTLEALRKKGMVQMEKSGTKLTREGRNRFRRIIDSVGKLAELSLKEITLDEANLAVSIKEIPDLNCEPWKCHDLAVKEGASGALILEVRDGLRFADTGEEVGIKNPEDKKEITSEFPDWEQVDFLIIVSGPVYEKANLGLWRIVSELIDP